MNFRNAFEAAARALAALAEAIDATAARLGDPEAQRRAARRLGQVPCDFPHEKLAPDYPRPYGACPLCGAAR